ncbi:5'-methylthioadenosine/S-adenosylhomocysteine nucleosidase [Kingella potus]|uniref:5'-methylthioadenosine/S-adenosylhomocysteine nucleosidase n=1 Tax=Kingella potus TaxID=265175 RepID=A0A377R134_9NEIS|nr:5'-methylthioadenosine/adenosylhomocysteine nucleosidase [Kingella potus]STR00962.1 5'-methylthioadenosine/S-adenosylhomocysteine nucleosidase [Kingella potus]
MSGVRTIAVIGAMQPEIELLKGRLNGPETHRFGAFEIHTGEIAGKRIILTLSGIGKANAAAATAAAILKFAPCCVINTGSAGGLASGLKVGDVVIGSETVHHDVDATVFGYAPGQVPQLPPAFAADEALMSAAEAAARAFPLAAVTRGLIASGDQFVHSSEAAAAIRARFPAVQAVEMEAAAIAQTCHQFGVPFVVVRALSDSADEKADTSFEQFLQTASAHSAEMVGRMIAAL